MASIGIDLGTTNSAVAHLQNEPKIIENQGRATTPSAVAYEDGELLVGQPAKDQAIVLPSVLSVKRDMGTDIKFTLGDRQYTPEEISAMILKELKKVAEERLEEPVDSAIITIPAYFHGAQKEATKRAGELAGLKNIRLLPEPIAAALAFGAEDVILVYDLGGGTFDVAIIECFDYEMVGLAGDNHLGGDDFDNCLVARLAREVRDKFGVDIESTRESKQLAKSACEKAKINLSTREKTTIVYQTVIKGKPINVRLVVTREEFEDMTRHLIDKTIALLDSAIVKAKEKDDAFSKDEIQTILLVGGSTYIPAVRRSVAEYFGKEPSARINPDLAVALGAAYHTASGPAPKGVHQIRLSPLPPTVTAKTECVVSGRTSPGSRIEVTGAAGSVSAVANDRGKFTLTVELITDTTNEITVQATNPDNEMRKITFKVRHGTDVTEEEQERRRTDNVGGGLLPRTLGVGVTGDDNRLGVIIPGQTKLPCSLVSRDYCIMSNAPNMPGMCPIDIYEGDLAYAPLNTHLANLMLQTAASPSNAEPMEITFQVTEDHLLKVTARMINYPDRMVTAEVKCQSASGNRLHVIERAERLINLSGDKLRPEDRLSISKAKQGLEDMSEQYTREPQKERFERIKQMGLQLQADLDRLEASIG